jgi:hypothetical protein
MMQEETLDEYSEIIQNIYHIPLLKLHTTLRSTIFSTSNINWSSVSQAASYRTAAAQTVREGHVGRVDTWCRI